MLWPCAHHIPIRAALSVASPIPFFFFSLAAHGKEKKERKHVAYTHLYTHTTLTEATGYNILPSCHRLPGFSMFSFVISLDVCLGLT